MSDRTQMLNDIADTADALSEPRRHTEDIPYWDANRNRKTSKYTIDLPSLLDQLEDQAHTTTSGADGDSAAGGPPASQPPGDLDAIACHAAITRGATDWVLHFGGRPRDNVASNVRAIVGLAATIDSDTQANLLADLRHWVRWAETATGWRMKPYTTVAPCPTCQVRGTVRVRLDERSASCAACGEKWDDEEALDGLVAHERTWLAASSQRTERAWATYLADKGAVREATRRGMDEALADARRVVTGS